MWRRQYNTKVSVWWVFMWNFKCSRKVVQVATKTFKIKCIKSDRQLLRSCFIFWRRNNVIFRIQPLCTFASLPLLESLAFTQKSIIKVIFRKHLRYSTNLLLMSWKFMISDNYIWKRCSFISKTKKYLYI